MDRKDRDRLEAAGVKILRWQEVLSEYDPDFFAALTDWSIRGRKHQELDPKVREFILIAIDAVVAYPNIDIHFNNAFDMGATIVELVDVIAATGRLMGPHPMNHGLTALDRVIEDRRSKGLKTPRSRNAK